MTAPFAVHGFGESPEVALDDVPVRGELPDWLTGSLIRNGPGTFQVGERRYRHWFDGLAMLHRFTINEGRVSYANRFLETESYRIARDEGRIAFPEFATDPCRSMFARAMAVFDPQATDSAKVNIARVAEHYLALAETPIQVEFDPETLRTVGVTGWDTLELRADDDRPPAPRRGAPRGHQPRHPLRSREHVRVPPRRHDRPRPPRRNDPGDPRGRASRRTSTRSACPRST